MLLVTTPQGRRVVLPSDRVVLIHPEQDEQAAIVMADGTIVHAREAARDVSMQLAALRRMRLALLRSPPSL